jgi:hypothetical protein
MPTTRRTAVPVIAGDEVTPAGFATMPGDEPPVAAGDIVDLSDSRTDALHSLFQNPAIIESDKNPPRPVGRRLPPLTGDRWEWDPAGDWYLVFAELYPRMMWTVDRQGKGADVRQQARAGDLVQVPNDDRTARDVAQGFLIPAPQAAADLIEE